MGRVCTGAAVVLLLVAPASAIAQRTTSDAAIGRLVTQRLTDEDINSIGVSVASGIVTLRGTVPTLWIKQRAIEEAGKIDDVISVFSQLTVRYGESDDRIAVQVAQRLQRYVFYTIFDDANVDVNEGVVAFARDQTTWMNMARDLVREAEATIRIADAKNREELEKAGDSVYATCKACHGRYMSRSVQ